MWPFRTRGNRGRALDHPASLEHLTCELVGRFQSLTLDDVAKATPLYAYAKQLVERLSSQDSRPADERRGDANQLEVLLVDLAPIEDVRSDLVFLQADHSAIAPQADIQALQSSSVWDDEVDRDVRAKAKVVIRQIQWYQAIRAQITLLRGALTDQLVRSLWIGLPAPAFAGVLAWCNIGSPHFWLIIAGVAAAGFLGGHFSALRRIRVAPIAPTAGALARLKAMAIGRNLSPLFGQAFALVLYLLFAGGLIEGKLFPAMSCAHVGYCWPLPQDSAEDAKLVLWSFLAGWAEQMVPDRLDALADHAARASRP